LVGALALIASFLLQATALNIGALAAVEPVLVLELPITLILGAVLLHHHLHTRDWAAAAVMAAGLATLIAVLSPLAAMRRASQPRSPCWRWGPPSRAC
jgi:drug/metabolite transporter (DMT)-like permease